MSFFVLPPEKLIKNKSCDPTFFFRSLLLSVQKLESRFKIILVSLAGYYFWPSLAIMCTAQCSEIGKSLQDNLSFSCW